MSISVRVVLVSPEHDSNVGAAARVMKNFGCTDLAIVNPVAPLGFDVKKFAKHSLEVIENSKRYASIPQAVKGFDYVVATSGVVDRYSGRLKNTVILPDLPKLIGHHPKVAIVFGRESVGLLKEELDLCDAVCVIPANKAHTVLNLSHAVGVVLYELFRSGIVSPDSSQLLSERELLKRKPATRTNRRSLEKMFQELVHKIPSVRDPEKVSAALRNVIERSRATDEEVCSIMAAISPLRSSKNQVNRPRSVAPISKKKKKD